MYNDDELHDMDELRKDCNWEMQLEKRKARSERIWLDTYNVDQPTYFMMFLEQQGIYREFKDWLVDALLEDYPEDEEDY